jgi:hypothetical protein
MIRLSRTGELQRPLGLRLQLERSLAQLLMNGLKLNLELPHPL